MGFFLPSAAGQSASEHVQSAATASSRAYVLSLTGEAFFPAATQSCTPTLQRLLLL